jgi:hypothetical protein
MNVGIGNEVAQFHLWEYINLIYGTVWLMLNLEYRTQIQPAK